MPTISTRQQRVATLSAFLGPAVGTADDFWTLAYSHVADELERANDPQHGQFTYVLRYQLPRRTLVGRYPRRLDDLWQRSDGSLIAVGQTRGYVEISAGGLQEVALSPVPGVYTSVSGITDQHIYATGCAPGFIHYDHAGQWSLLPLPDGAEWINDADALAPDDVYFVGDNAQIHHFDGKRVTQLKVPSRRHLLGIARLDATRLCVSGYQGAVLVGNRHGWRNLVTNIVGPLLAVAVLDHRAYFAADQRVWSTDGTLPPIDTLDYPARWVSGLADGLVLSHDDGAALYSGGNLIDLDVTL